MDAIGGRHALISNVLPVPLLRKGKLLITIVCLAEQLPGRAKDPPTSARIHHPERQPSSETGKQLMYLMFVRGSAIMSATASLHLA